MEMPTQNSEQIPDLPDRWSTHKYLSQTKLLKQTKTVRGFKRWSMTPGITSLKYVKETKH